MWLINVETLKLDEFHDKIPRYAILSHTWRNDNEELTFRDVGAGILDAPGGIICSSFGWLGLGRPLITLPQTDLSGFQIRG
jgi:hypothetical protein